MRPDAGGVAAGWTKDCAFPAVLDAPFLDSTERISPDSVGRCIGRLKIAAKLDIAPKTPQTNARRQADVVSDPGLRQWEPARQSVATMATSMSTANSISGADERYLSRQTGMPLPILREVN